MSEEENNVENLYVSDEPQEMEIEGVTIKYKELSGTEFAEMSEELDIDPQEPGSALNEEYFEKMIDKCVIEPELDVSRLKSGPLMEIMSEIQGGLTLEEGIEDFR